MADQELTVIPTEQMRAVMSILQAKKVQEPMEIVLNDDVDRFIRTRNFLYYLGLRPGQPVYEAILGRISKVGLSEAAKKMDPYLRMQMIETPEDDGDDYAMCSPRVYADGAEAADAPAAEGRKEIDDDNTP